MAINSIMQMPNWEDYLGFVAKRESNDNPEAKNPNSSAFGRYQLIRKTYEAYKKKLKLPDFPGTATSRLKAMKQMTVDNYNIMRKKLKRDPSAADMYAAHHFGPSVGGRLAKERERLRAGGKPRPMAAVIGKKAMEANPYLQDHDVNTWFGEAEQQAEEHSPALAIAAPDIETQMTEDLDTADQQLEQEQELQAQAQAEPQTEMQRRLEQAEANLQIRKEEDTAIPEEGPLPETEIVGQGKVAPPFPETLTDAGRDRRSRRATGRYHDVQDKLDERSGKPTRAMPPLDGAIDLDKNPLIHGGSTPLVDAGLQQDLSGIDPNDPGVPVYESDLYSKSSQEDMDYAMGEGGPVGPQERLMKKYKADSYYINGKRVEGGG